MQNKNFFHQTTGYDSIVAILPDFYIIVYMRDDIGTMSAR